MPPSSGSAAYADANRVLFAVTVAQALVALANSTLPAIAPKLAQAFAVDASLIGYQVSLVFGCGMLGTLMSGALVGRYGACRATQICAACCGVGLAIATVPSLVFVLLGSVLIGLGLGLINAPAADLMVRFTPPERRNLTFSIKQMGVPLGGMGAALTAPYIALTFGWQWALVPGIVLALLIIAMYQTFRKRWDASHGDSGPRKSGGLGGVMVVWSVAPLRWIALTGLCFSAIQRCVLTFTVALLVGEAGYGLIEAGVLLSVVQAGGVFGRPFWGWVADRVGSGLNVLQGISLITIVACLLVVMLTARWPLAAVCALFFVFGACSVGWNGVMHAETARLSPTGMVSATAGGSSFFIFAGVLVGPALFTTVYRFVGSYTATFGLFTVLGIAGSVLLIVARRSLRKPAA